MALQQNITSQNATSKPILMQNMTLDQIPFNATLSPNVTLNYTIPSLPQSPNITLQNLPLNITALPKLTSLMNTTTTMPNAANITANITTTSPDAATVNTTLDTTEIYPNLANITAQHISAPNITIQMSSPKMPTVVPSSNATVANKPIKQITLQSKLANRTSSRITIHHHHKKPSLTQSSSQPRHPKRNKKHSVKSSMPIARKHHKHHKHNGHKKSHQRPSKVITLHPALSSSGHQHRKPKPHTHKSGQHKQTLKHRQQRLLSQSHKPVSDTSSSSTSSKSTESDSPSSDQPDSPSSDKPSVHKHGRKILHKALKHEPSENLPLKNVTIQNNLLQKMTLTPKLPNHTPSKRVRSPKIPKEIPKTSFSHHYTSKHLQTKLNTINTTLPNVHMLLKLHPQTSLSTSSSSSSSSSSSPSSTSDSSVTPVPKHKHVPSRNIVPQNMTVQHVTPQTMLQQNVTLQHISSNITSPSKKTIFHTLSANEQLPNITVGTGPSNVTVSPTNTTIPNTATPYNALQLNKLNITLHHIPAPNITVQMPLSEYQTAIANITTQHTNATMPSQQPPTKQISNGATTLTNTTTKYIPRPMSPQPENSTTQHTNATIPNQETPTQPITNGTSTLTNITTKYIPVTVSPHSENKTTHQKNLTMPNQETPYTDLQINKLNISSQHEPAPNITVGKPSSGYETTLANIKTQLTNATMPKQQTQTKQITNGISILTNTITKYVPLQMSLPTENTTNQHTNVTISNQQPPTKQITNGASILRNTTIKKVVIQPNLQNNTLQYLSPPNTTVEVPPVAHKQHRSTNTTTPLQSPQTTHINNHALLLNTTMKNVSLQPNRLNATIHLPLTNATTPSPLLNMNTPPGIHIKIQKINATMSHQHTQTNKITYNTALLLNTTTKYDLLQPRANQTLQHISSLNITTEISSPPKMPVHPVTADNITMVPKNETITSSNQITNHSLLLLNTTKKYISLQPSAMTHTIKHMPSPNIMAPKMPPHYIQTTTPHQNVSKQQIAAYKSSNQTKVNLHANPLQGPQQQQPNKKSIRLSPSMKHQKSSPSTSSQTSSSSTSPSSTSSSSSSTKNSERHLNQIPSRRPFTHVPFQRMTTHQVVRRRPIPRRRPFRHEPFQRETTQQVVHRHTPLHNWKSSHMYRPQLPNTTLHLTSLGSAMSPKIPAQKAVFKLSISPENEPLTNTTRKHTVPSEQISLNVTLPHIPSLNITFQSPPLKTYPRTSNHKKTTAVSHVLAIRASSEQTFDLHHSHPHQIHQHKLSEHKSPQQKLQPLLPKLQQHQQVKPTTLINAPVQQTQQLVPPERITQPPFATVKNPAPLETIMGRCVNVSNRSGHSGSFVATG